MEMFEAKKLVENAYASFLVGNIGKAAVKYTATREFCLSKVELINSAAMANNQCIALLKMGDSQTAINLARGSENKFFSDKQ